MGQFQIVSWNIRQGGGKRIAGQIDAISKIEPEIIALQEITEASISRYVDALAVNGYGHTETSLSGGTKLTGPRRFGVLVASRWSLVRLDEESGVPWPEKILRVIVKAPWGDVEVTSVHVPPGCSNGLVKVETLEGLHKLLAIHTPVHRILCGDFNTPRLETTGGQITTWGQKITGEIVSARRERWDSSERGILAGLGQYDLSDVFRQLNGYERQDHSWYLRRKGKVIPRRYDHIFASTALSARHCSYVHDMRERGLSDHSPIVATFEPV